MSSRHISIPYFSVVIPTFNRADKLAVTVQSVLDQTFKDFELLVMDDGSTDHTRTVVSGFSDPRIKYDLEVNSGGPATPRNRGIEAAAAPWICFLDADDIWYPNRLSELAQAIAQNLESDVFCHDEVLNMVGAKEKIRLRYGPFEDDFYRVMLTQGNRLSTSAVTVRADFLNRHKLRFNQAKDYVIVEDYDLWLRLANEGARFTFISKPLGEYIIENDNISLATGKARYNEQGLLKDHVYLIQQFEPDKDKLWRQIRLRLDIEVGRELLGQGSIVSGLRMLSEAFITQPLQTLKILATKFQYKLIMARLS